MATDSSSSMEQTDLYKLVGHDHAVPSSLSLEDVYQVFRSGNQKFMAVIENQECIGLCSRRDIGMLLGHRFGNALFATQPVGKHCLPEYICIHQNEPVSNVLERVFGRDDDTFFDDVVLLNCDHRFLGLIHVTSLVRLQTRFMREHIHTLNVQSNELNSRYAQMRTDLMLARKLQQAMLPQLNAQDTQLNSRHPLNIHHRYHAAGDVGGDFFHILHIDEHRIGVLICDVMGHEVRSALITAMIRALVEALRPSANEPGPFLTRMNRDLHMMLRQTDDSLFVTALYAVIDIQDGKVRYAKAGHHDALRLNRQNGHLNALDCPPGTAGPALGLFEHSQYGTSEQYFTEGDLIMLFTDGLFEVFNHNEEEFGFDRLKTLIQNKKEHPPQRLFDEVFEELHRYSGQPALEDDACVVGIEYGRISCGDS